MAKYIKNIILAALSGLILGFAYPGWKIDAGFLVWVGLIPLIFSLFSGPTAKGIGKYWFWFLNGFTAGLVYFLIVLRWILSIHPLNTLGIDNRLVSALIAFLIYFFSAFGIAVFWGLFSLLGSALVTKAGGQYKTKSGTIILGLALASFFVLAEYGQNFGFGFVWLGSGTVWGSHWTMGNLAYSLANNSLILKLDSFLGIYGVSFIIFIVNFLFSRIITSQKTPAGLLRRGVIVALAIWLISFGPSIIRTQKTDPAQNINFAVAQTNIETKAIESGADKLSSLREQLGLLDKIAKEHPATEIIVFPEASDLFKNITTILTTAQVKTYFQNLFSSPKLITAGAKVVNRDKVYSRVFYLDTKNGITGFYDKKLLTPGGEFLPYHIKWIANLFSKNKATAYTDSLRELSPGQNDNSAARFRNGVRVSTLVCSEILSPGLTRKLTADSDIILAMASYGIFHGNDTVNRQNMAVARFRAVETGKPIIESSNMGRSYAINGAGVVIAITPDERSQILTGSVGLYPLKPWYNRVGDFPILLISLITACLSFFLIRKPILFSEHEGYVTKT